MKILVSAAKTGGHIFPAIAVADELIKSGHDVVFLGGGEKIERDAVSGKDFNYQTIKMNGFRGKNTVLKIKSLILIPLGIINVIEFNTKRKNRCNDRFWWLYNCTPSNSI